MSAYPYDTNNPEPILERVTRYLNAFSEWILFPTILFAIVYFGMRL